MNEAPSIHATGGTHSVTEDAMASAVATVRVDACPPRAAPAISSYRYVAQTYFAYAFAVFILSSAARNPRASFTASSLAQ